jgi:hypothetical protein
MTVEIASIQIGDLEPAARGGLQAVRELDDLTVEERPVTAKLDFGLAGFSSMDGLCRGRRS